eukprot:scaffold4423_cov67-Phaeocystis_antarctica.AAC.3
MRHEDTGQVAQPLSVHGGGGVGACVRRAICHRKCVGRCRCVRRPTRRRGPGAPPAIGRRCGLQHRKEQARPCEHDGGRHTRVAAVGCSLAAEIRDKPLGCVTQARRGRLAGVHFAPVQGDVPRAQQRNPLAVKQVAKAEPPGGHCRGARAEELARKGVGVPRGGSLAGARGVLPSQVEPVVFKLAEAVAEVRRRVFHPHERGTRVEGA